MSKNDADAWKVFKCDELMKKIWWDGNDDALAVVCNVSEEEKAKHHQGTGPATQT